MSSTALVDDVLVEILLRLPPESVLRFRAVSKHWRRITTCPTFLAAYSRRRPLELLGYPDGYKMGIVCENLLAAMDPLNSPGTGCRRFLRFDGLLHLVDCRDGVLLFALKQKRFLICNPATRQWASLPSLTPEPCTFVVASGLYFHRPSGEHRVLCVGNLPPRGYKYDPVCGGYYCSEVVPAPAADDYIYEFHYILSTGAAAGKRLRRLGPVAEGKRIHQHGIPSPCLAVGTTLYWSRHPEAVEKDSIVAFDTLSETFRVMCAPPLVGRHRLRLFDMDGTLAMSATREGSPCMEVWALGEDGDGDGDGKTWVCIVRLDDLPPPRRWFDWLEAVVVLEGDVLLVVGSGWVVLYDMKEKRTVSRVDHSAGIPNLSLCLYRTNLVPLATEPEAQMPCRRGKPLLEFCSPDGPYMPLSGSNRCETWIVPNGSL